MRPKFAHTAAYFCSAATVYFLLACYSQAIAACNPAAPGVLECTGDQSGGVPNPPGGIVDLKVFNLTTDIAPASGTIGITFSRAAPSKPGAGGIGEDGDAGDPGPSVLIEFDGSKQIRTDSAAGIFGSSIGGGGGNGSDAGLVVDGGAGGAGGAGGPVTIISAGFITTTGGSAPGIVAFSRGGNGGIGGDEFVGTGGDAGNGGGGGPGGTVTVNSQSNMTTNGADSSAIIARSFGGDGGNGGTGFLTVVGSGGGGGATGTGGAVNVTSSGVLQTNGPNNSAGIFAQSVGGFAGAAGSSFGLFAFGGDGNSGGGGGNIDVNATAGSITTMGASSWAIFAQSVGGGGGNGGTGGGLVGLGGGGSVGGDGGEVKVQNHAVLDTTGNGSGGIVAQSVGGGGGSGGTGAGLVAVGGSGGGGGNGKKVEVGNHAAITVRGNGAGFELGTYGIFAQSVGGGGGSANFSGGLVTFGGTGGKGGNAGDVIVSNDAKIQSLCAGGGCEFAGAIYAQSVGGGGGRGGGAGGLVAIGGQAADGGDGLAVTVGNSGELTANGAFSRGIFAQSVGGGGGDGGFAGGMFSIGSQGGRGGNANLVKVINGGNITTNGKSSQGIFAQSVGGGGGSGSNTVAAGVFAAVSIGGKGGSGGDAGAVEVNKDVPLALANINTTGDGSAGVFAQSVGGGGGNGGFAISASGGVVGGVTLGIGGDGGKGGEGRNVYVGSAGSILTNGIYASGIYAESVGGGGGHGGFSIGAGVTISGVQATLAFGGKGGAGGSAGEITVFNQSSITTGCETCASDQSHGIFASSIGGGGGDGGFSIAGAGSTTVGSLAASFGGNGAQGNQGKLVDVANSGRLETFGLQSDGILAQSIGGGGGSGGFSGALTIAIGAGPAGSLSFGGDGGDGGQGGKVNVRNSADIFTHADSSAAIFAQSIGGGGGNGGFAGAIGFSSQGPAFSLAIGGNAGPGSTSNDVTVTHSGNIGTLGNNATGIFAQSVGGGGGNGGFSLSAAASLSQRAESISVGGKGGSGGTSGVVTVGTITDPVKGSIVTSSSLSHGIQAQSIGGGGGNGGFAVGAGFSLDDAADVNAVGGKGGTGQNGNRVEVNNLAAIFTGATCSLSGCAASGGSGSIGIFAQSVGGGGGSGGFSVGAGFSLNGKASTSTVGGNGAGAGDGKEVIVTSSGFIETFGVNSHGILAQSIGGGGGTGAFSITAGASIKGDAQAQALGGQGGAAGKGGTVDVSTLQNITTHGNLSHGVFAQSVGGGGGSGGFSGAAGFSLEANSSVTSVGGSGSGGGSGDTVKVTVGSATNSNVSIQTFGEGSIGVLAQSIGGGGGDGGFSGGLSLSVKGTADNKVGGANGTDGTGNPVGGKAGNGGEVQVKNWGTILTDGNNAAGVLAQSVGGGGGNGGMSIAGSLDKKGGTTNSIGGSAGEGGFASKVTVDNFGIITTSGNFSHGIIAQSIGGGGGNGGFSIAATLSTGDQGSTSEVGGGAGGGGGNGGEVVVNNTGTITVTGQNSFGVFAQSVGGGGGSGGFAGGLALGGTLKNAVGGNGAKGGNGGDVTVTSTGSIKTTQANSSAVFAQSVGGGGGWGGFSIGIDTGQGSDGLKLGLGATGGVFDLLPVDGQQGKVTVTIDGGTTVTEGALSYGLLGQAIGGGGGAAGTVIAGLLNFIGSDVNLQVGSNGSINGNGTLQTSTNFNDVTTSGLGSIGMVSQSVGGGGGVNGLVIADTLSLNPNGADKFDIRVGGFSGGVGLVGGGNGGGFDATAKGTVTTTNDNAIGVLAQTIGGGGGVGNITIHTLQNASSSLTVTVGGSQIATGNAGPDSIVKAEKAISTSGVLSHGLVAQSIGGGGGVSNIVIQSAATVTNGADLVLGSGPSGGGGNGGKVTAITHDITTSGLGAMGLVAQSIGGGGGLIGLAVDGKAFGQPGFSVGHVDVSPGLFSLGGNGGVVVVEGQGSVHTYGYGAHGIVAQSIGGGGGIAGTGLYRTSLASGSGAFAGSASFSPFGASGNASDVTVSTFKNVVVDGADSFGIFAQSAAGFGGTSGNAHVNVSKSGNGVGLVWAKDGSGAAVAFADGVANALKSDGTLYAQKSTFGSGLPRLDGMAVLGGSGAETITNLAYAFPPEPVPGGFNFGSDYGIAFNINSGLTDPATLLPIFVGTRTSAIIGNIHLASGENGMVNENGGLLISESKIVLDTTGTPLPIGQQTLQNDGLLSPGDRGRVQVTSIAGNFVQSGTGSYFIDVDLNKQNTPDPVTDRINLTGDAAVDGKAPLLLLSINKAFTEYVIADATSPGETITDNGLTPLLIPGAVGFKFKVRVDNSAAGDDLVLFAEKPALKSLLQDPASGTKDPNVWRMGEGIDRIETAIGVDDPFNYLINLLRLSPDLKTLGDAVVSLTPSNAPHIFEITQRRSSEFADAAIGCPHESRDGLFIDKRNCFWGRGIYGEYDRDSVQDSPLDEDRFRAVTVGAQSAINENWQLGFGVEVTDVDSKQIREGKQLSSLDANIYHVGLSAGYRDGPFGVALAATASHGDWKSKRNVHINGYSQTYSTFSGVDAGSETPIYSQNKTNFAGIDGVAESDAELFASSQLLRFSYLNDLGGGVEVMPYLDVEGHVAHSRRRTETGVGLANLTYAPITETSVTFTPGLQLGLTTQLGESLSARAFVRAGVALSPNDKWTTETQFVAAPAGLPSIIIEDKRDRAVAKVEAGLLLFNQVGQQVHVDYAGEFGETTTSHEVRGGFNINF